MLCSIFLQRSPGHRKEIYCNCRRCGSRLFSFQKLGPPQRGSNNTAHPKILCDICTDLL
ncbi:hypothetical protein KI387_010418 [Taxus chinensis]|uniref:Uncharacterized protein n=1 Tax=Taxus chinensis TaxID=29808 RepID=A0AA38FLE7_TAXCH|nr:hypothetical protein KI387_010418 [Taxus chinensis]